jgi:C1A family cysteine protease
MYKKLTFTNKIMKLLFSLIILVSFSITYAQPPSFSWYNSNNSNLNYISPAKNQGEQSPCHIFAAVAAVEALSHIYYNKPFAHASNGLDLSEREIYSWCSGFGGPQGSASIEEALN